MSEKLARLNEIKKILHKAFGNWSYIYRPLKIEVDTENDYKLTFSCDCYFEPIFMMFKLFDYGVVKMKIEYGGSETDRIVISDGNVEILQKLDQIEKWAENTGLDNAKLEKHLLSFGCKKIEKVPETGPIIIDELDHQYTISRARWSAYWATKGQTGPANGFEIPTYETIMKVTAEFQE